MQCNFMSFRIEFVHQMIIRVLVRDEEGSGDGTFARIKTITEGPPVKLYIRNSYSIVEGEDNKLRCFRRRQETGNIQ